MIIYLNYLLRNSDLIDLVIYIILNLSLFVLLILTIYKIYRKHKSTDFKGIFIGLVTFLFISGFFISIDQEMSSEILTKYKEQNITLSNQFKQLNINKLINKNNEILLEISKKEAEIKQNNQLINSLEKY